MRFNFGSTSHLCSVCGKLRKGGYHEPCSKKLQAEAKHRRCTATKTLTPHAQDHLTARLGKL